MKTEAAMGMVGILGTLLIATAPAEAQIQPQKSEIHVYAGELFGDDFSEGRLRPDSRVGRCLHLRRALRVRLH